MRALLRGLAKRFSSAPTPAITVDFIICGTQKGGTTALYAYLREHPEVCMAERKEVHFFDDEKNFAQNQPARSRYRSSSSSSRRSRAS